MRNPAPDARVERRACDLLGSVAGAEALAMYEELGFLEIGGGEGYGYLLYPHRPIVSYDAGSGEPLSEYCVRFADEDERRLPDADDVLAKWMALHGDERGLISRANMGRPGGQLDPAMVRRDIDHARVWRGARA